MKTRDIEYITNAHQNYPKKPSKAFRKCDGKTLFSVHPLWCAITIEGDTRLDGKTKQEGSQALLYHDIVEDTTKPLPEHLSDRVKELVNQMTFSGGMAQEIQEVWDKPIEIKLYKLYDKVSNMLDSSWMSVEKKQRYTEYTRKLCNEVENYYGELNITIIARAITARTENVIKI